MALPKLNDKPKYELVIPSTDQKVRYRPYLTKEEKVMLMALESQDNKAMMDAIVDTIVACVDDEIDRKKLSMFDVEYMFLKIRSKSVGETSTVAIKCSECNTDNEVTIDISAIEINVPNVEKTIQITPEIAIEMKWPTYEEIVKIGATGNPVTKNLFAVIEKSINAIVTEDERIMAKDVSEKEIEEFVESMTKSQLEMLGAYMSKMPTLNKEVHFDCTSCKTHNDIKLEGMTDFF